MARGLQKARGMSALRPIALASFAALTSAAVSAGAVQQPAHLRSGLELTGGGAARLQRTVSGHTPRRAERSWRSFEADVGGRWIASWDEATGVPSRIFGTGVPAAGTVASDQAAAKVAGAFLARHLDLLAPGASPSDFVLVSNELRDGMRTVAYLQHHAGMRVLGGQLSFRFKNDRLFVIASEALPAVRATQPATLVDEQIARAQAAAWIAQDFGSTPTAAAVEGPFVLPILSPGSVRGYRTVLRVVVSSSSPVGRWNVYVDAHDGSVVAREQTLRFAQGTVRFDAPVRRPGDARSDYVAKHVQVEIEATQSNADADGLVTFADGAPVDVTLLARSPFVKVMNEAGAQATTVLSLDPGGTILWSDPDTPAVDAQLNSFIHTQLAKDHAAVLAPQMSWLNAQLTVNVNADDECNAFYDGVSINFFRESNQCENTGRLADVIYHEFGHGLHHHAAILGSGELDGALGEGVGDYFAATITGDPGMGRGFFYSNEPLRHIDPDNGEYVWPDDIQEIHETGRIIAGALWDLRKALVSKYGESEGVATTDRLFYGVIANAADIPSSYAEVLAADDDDGNLENGTPNVCEIAETFGAHGLRSYNVALSLPTAGPPSEQNGEVSIKIDGLFDQCLSDGVAEARLVWGLRSAKGQLSTVVMSGGPAEFVGTIPPQQAGEVVVYRVEIELNAGAVLAFPDNPADDLYEMFVGEVVPLYCTDFETDPMLEGWKHALLSGTQEEGADDWQWGTPAGNSLNGDPGEAFSGTSIFGNDLGHGNYNGLYQSSKVNVADSPAVAVGEHTNIRLQYRRWLAVEDGYFDHARIYANGEPVWSNRASSDPSNATVHHTDREWRFHDVDVSDQVDADGNVKIRFEIDSDSGLELGGWSLDDFCVVAYDGGGPADPVCGNGTVEPGEGCDDGNQAAGDGCSALCQPETELPADDPTDVGPIVVDGGCGCRTASGSGDSASWSLALLALAAAGWRRRRR